MQLPDLQGYLPQFLDALQLTVALAMLAMAAAMVIGLLLAGLRMSNAVLLRAPALAYIEVMRNTPLLLQIYIIYFGLPLVGIELSSFYCGVLGIALQHSAFLAEIYRAGIENVAQRQREAAKSLGMSRLQSLRLVVLPIAARKVVPVIGNQLVILVKDTSLVASIGVLEMTLTAKKMIERTGASFEVFLLVAILYLGLTTLLGIGLRCLEGWQQRRS